MKMNFNRSGGLRLLKDTIPNDALLECWKECMNWSEFDELREEIDRFNKTSENVKRGIAMSATRMGIGHPGARPEAVALVQIFKDGSVAVMIGGIEVEQRLISKCQQVASRALRIPTSLITILGANRDRNTNGGNHNGGDHNGGDDIQGRAILACCERLMAGLRPLLKEEGGWGKAVWKAYKMRIPLQASEYTGGGNSRRQGVPLQSQYNTTGAACIVSQIDCRTGEQSTETFSVILSVDVVLDAGRRLNPAEDISLIEGAFLMSYSSLTFEKVTYDDKGKLVENTFSLYKLPSASVTPKKFRVKLLRESESYDGQVASTKVILF
ncbi:aldehyde oxidase and xanthine dehydrogenase, molybdopterin binding domain protein [Cooperia oncophora]